MGAKHYLKLRIFCITLGFSVVIESGVSKAEFNFTELNTDKFALNFYKKSILSWSPFLGISIPGKQGSLDVMYKSIFNQAERIHSFSVRMNVSI